MTTIKKKDLKKFKTKPKQELDELVDADGSPIEGNLIDTNDGGGVNNSEITTAPQQTSDDLAQLAIQPSRFFFSSDGTPYSHGNRSGSQKESVKNSEKEELDEVAKDKMRKMVEDIVAKRLDNQNSGMVNKVNSPDVNRNGIPDIEELANNIGKPAAARHAQIFIYDINKTPLVGDEKAIVLNYILSNFNLNDVSDDYKNLLRKKL
jgi:hypothetical protein